jgi:hypothetical protein
MESDPALHRGVISQYIRRRMSMLGTLELATTESEAGFSMRLEMGRLALPEAATSTIGWL